MITNFIYRETCEAAYVPSVSVSPAVEFPVSENWLCIEVVRLGGNRASSSVIFHLT